MPLCIILGEMWLQQDHFSRLARQAVNRKTIQSPTRSSDRTPFYGDMLKISPFALQRSPQGTT